MLRSELQELTTRTLSLAADCAFRRERDPIGGIATVLAPTPAQSGVARKNDESLRQWSAIVSSVLRRRGVAAPNLQSLVGELSNLTLLKRRDRPIIRENEWRKAFESELAMIRLQLDELVARSSDAFCNHATRGASSYDVLDVRVRELDSQQWCVEAVSNGERATNTVAAPGLAEIDEFIATHCGPDHDQSPDSVPSVLESMTRFGQRLYGTVFQNSIAALYEQAREHCRAQGKRLRIQFAANSLAEVPWELLHDGANFLGLSVDVSLTRCAGPARIARPFITESEPLRILLTVSSPIDQTAIDCEEEIRVVSEAVSSRRALGLLQLDVASDGSLGTLRRMLRSAEREGRPYHAWHFAGHGRYDSGSRRTTIAMTGAGGEAQWAGGPELATILAEASSLRLVLLKSCEGGAGTVASPLPGLVSMLIASGVSAVVAMRFEISYEACAVFDDEFYGAIADGATVDEAVAASRCAILDRPNYTEWITPSVFHSGGEVAWFDPALP